jgi:hypothetical protein
MRKYLLSTSTLAGAALLSSVAVADVSISGYMEWEMINGDTDSSKFDGTSMAINNEVGIDFTNKTDSGLTITLNTDLDTDSGGVDDNSMSISGGFGKIVVGETDGAEDVYAIHAAALVAEEHNMPTGTTTFVDTDNDIMTATGSQLTGNGNKISYHLPAMGGLTAGASFQDSGYNTSTDLTEFGANYAMEAGGAAVTIGYTTATQEGATKDSDSTTLGVQVVMGAMSIIANQATVDTATDDETGNSFGISYALPNGMTLAATTMTAEDDGATDLGEEYSVNHYELTYPVASGLSVLLNVSDYDYKTGAGNTEKTADSGTFSSIMLKASF